MIDRDNNEEEPADSTEEYLLGGLDEDAEIEAPPHRDVSPPDETSGQPPAEQLPGPAEPVASDPPPKEPPADQPATGTHSEQPAHQADQPPAEPGEYVEQPTEEVFALEARLLDGDDVPDLDPVFRAALLESPETAKPPVDETGEHTGEHSAEHEEPVTGETGEVDQGTAEWDQPSETGITAEQTAVLAAVAKSEVHQAIEGSRKSGEPWDPSRPPVGGDFEEPAKRRRYWWRFSLATLIIIFSFAAATSASILNEVDDFANEITDPDFQSLSDRVLPDSNGGPQTIAILGSDVRSGGGAPSGDSGRSDTTLLLRLDPDSGQIAMLSIPRDLKVEIPGYGTDKFNAAFSYGGPQLTLQTIKSVTGLDINHVINIDFQGFADIVDAIHCVFIDVDQHYYNSNEGVAPSEQYAEIDIEAGYQFLCGTDALEFARYRHGDSDLARAARQQDLVGEVRNRLSFNEVLSQRKDLINAFADNTKSDIEGGNQILELLKLLFDSRDSSVVEVKFPATDTLDNGISYVEATPKEIGAAVDKFLGFEASTGAVGTLDERGGSAKDKKKKKTKKKVKKRKAPTTKAPGKESDGLVDAASGGLEVAKTLDSEFKRRDFPIFYPKRLPEGTIYADGSRTYHLRDPDKNPYSAYRIVMALQLGDGLHYLGVQGIRKWEDPPILQAPHETITMNDRDFDVYYEGDRVKLIAWHEGGNTYWISNSILLTLTNEQMLGMARSTRGFAAG
ncbi:MAG: LCP family protein [Solirubrobacterales bacterium]|nr:LCP family protein [Solirubrobacterales bacterium]